MRVLLFGASGMVGQGVLRECLFDPDVESVLSVGRSTTGQRHEKLRELVHRDLFDLAPIERDLAGFDACFYCLGVSSVGMTDEAYRRVTFDLTVAVAGVLARLSPGMTFIYVSGMGTDGTGQGRVAWARVKGKTENALLRLPFTAAYMFRPAFIQPLHGIRSKTRLYQALYTITRPLLPLLRVTLPHFVTTTEEVGRAMLRVARHGAPGPVLENEAIRHLGSSPVERIPETLSIREGDVVTVSRSEIEGLGVFARRPFSAGQRIRRITVVRQVTPEAPLLEDLGERADHCDYPDGKVVLLRFPDRHLNHSCNHSCDPNAYVLYEADYCYLVARRDICPGDETTCDYNINITGGTAWACHCGAARCRGTTVGDFFRLPLDIQREYRPLLAEWFVRRHAERLAQLP